MEESVYKRRIKERERGREGIWLRKRKSEKKKEREIENASEKE